MLTLWQPLFQNFLLSVNHFLVLIKIHQIVEGNMCLKILYCRTPQPPLVLSVVLGLLDTCLDCVGLETQIKVIEFTQMDWWGFVEAWNRSPSTKCLVVSMRGCDLATTLDCFRILLPSLYSKGTMQGKFWFWKLSEIRILKKPSKQTTNLNEHGKNRPVTKCTRLVLVW